MIGAGKSGRSFFVPGAVGERPIDGGKLPRPFAAAVQSDAAALARIGVVLKRDAAGVASPAALKGWEFLKPDGSIGICSWCQREQGVSPQAGESHGICPEHFRAQMQRVHELNREGQVAA